MTTAPPRILAGATLIFWGGLSGNPFFGVVAAVLLEARSWVALRWDFKRASYVRAWHFSILIGALIGVLAWMNGMRMGKIHSLFIWVPLILMPVELAQRYGTAALIPLNTFSFFARRKMEENEQKGKAVSPRMINTGYPYVFVVLLATAMASENSLQHFVGLCIIMAAVLLCNLWKNGLRPWAWAASFLVVLVLGYGMQWGMQWLYYSYTGAGAGEDGRQTFTHESRTSIGRLGKLKLSPKIFWRMKVQHGDVPKLIRTATYNRYTHARWQHVYDPPAAESLRDDETDYLLGVPLKGERDIRTFNEFPGATEPSLQEQAHVVIVGEVPARQGQNPIPVPHFTVAIGDLNELGEDTSIETNSLGTLRLANQDYHVIEYAIWTGNASSTEAAPVGRYDLTIPPDEQESIKRISKQLGLADIPTTERKIERIRQFFNTEFTYSTHLETPMIDRERRRTAMGIFLETTRSGHCEYFATATALLLRESGVPARYCVGFSVSEKDDDRDEWVMRGTHSHAWCRVWMGDHWEDVDLTPPAWLVMDSNSGSGFQRKLADWWQRFTEDFLIWRTRGANKTKVVAVVSTIIGLLALWVGWRLWRSRNPAMKTSRALRKKLLRSAITPLHQLEPWLAKRIGPRPASMPMSTWLETINHSSELDHLARQAASLHDALRFDPSVELPSAQHEELKVLCQQLRQKFKLKSA
ncbi:MAG: transglutaminase-like domain-containing protein [Akkermansiaceae bacterium]